MFPSPEETQEFIRDQVPVVIDLDPELGRLRFFEMISERKIFFANKIHGWNDQYSPIDIVFSDIESRIGLVRLFFLGLLIGFVDGLVSSQNIQLQLLVLEDGTGLLDFCLADAYSFAGIRSGGSWQKIGFFFLALTPRILISSIPTSFSCLIHNSDAYQNVSLGQVSKDSPLDSLPPFLYSPSRNTLSNPVGLGGDVWPLETATPFLFGKGMGFFV